MINKMKIDLHKKMLDYYLDLMIKDENISTIKLLLEEIESLHSVVLKEYINLLPLDNIADRIIAVSYTHLLKKQQATMELYKKSKINPAGGCWPMLLPVSYTHLDVYKRQVLMYHQIRKIIYS